MTLYAQVGIGTGSEEFGFPGAKRSPFRTAVDVTDFDAASKSFAATARLYQRVTGDTR